MERRAFIGSMAWGLLAAPLAVQAQQPARPATIGVLASTQLTEGRSDRAAALAIELAHLKVDVIVALLTPAVQAAKNATSTIPIVMAPAGDPIASGFVTSLARPGRNLTGVTGIGAELAGKQLEALRQVVPRLTRLALLIHPAGDTFSKTLTAQTEAAAKTTSIRLHVVNVSNADELERAFATMAEHRDEGVIVQGPIFTTSFRRIAQSSLRHRLPSVSAPKEFAEAGGLLACGASQIDLARRATFYVARILRGAKPGDLPVEQPTTFELVINLKTAKALGLTIPPSLLQRADQVVE